MLYQGLYRILSLYFTDDLEIFLNKADKFVQNLVVNHLSNNNLKENELKQTISLLINSISSQLKQYFDTSPLEQKFQEIKIKSDNSENLNTSQKIFINKIIPILNETILDEIIFYLGGINGSVIIETLEKSKVLSLDMIIKLNKLKDDLSNYNKLENFQKYIRITESVCNKVCNNKIDIENLEDLHDLSLRVQINYLIYRIIDFFKLQNRFDFSHIKKFLKDNIDKWLIRTPVVTLTNPEIYYCGIYLANELEVDIDKKKVNDFLNTVAKSIVEETYTPLIEETDEVYYLLKAHDVMKKEVQPDMIQKLIKEEELFYDVDNLKLMETSKLAVILKIFSLLKIPDKLEIDHIETILKVIKERENSNGVKQYPNGVISSEATYYTFFTYYMRGLLKDLENTNYVGSIIEKIYTNLTFIEFSEDINFDLISELFYSCESLKLLNCVETKETLTQLSNFLFPEYVTEKIKNLNSIPKENIRFRYYRIEKITGHTIEII